MRRFLYGCFGLLALGCSVDTGPVSVEGQIHSGKCSLNVVALGSTYECTFRVQYGLSASAAADSVVELRNIALVSASDETTIVGSVQLPASTPTKVDVPRNSSLNIDIISRGDAVLDAATVAKLCAGPVKLVGSAEDVSKNEAVALASAPFQVSNCSTKLSA